MTVRSDPEEQEALRQIVAYLRTPEAIRQRCDRLFQLACAGNLDPWWCDLDKLDACADYTLAVMGEAYPDFNIPFHSRWQHFGRSRLEELETVLAEHSAIARARAKYDLAIVSVLLDAGAGATWEYVEPETGETLRRSEGLAVASFRMFLQGAFSSDSSQPLQVDAEGLRSLSEETLAAGFQVRSDNPLVGLAGRVNLLQNLGRSLQQHPDLFGKTQPRPGYLVDYLLGRCQAQGHREGERKTLEAADVLAAVLEGLGDIWSGRETLAGVNLGDVWRHPALQGDLPTDDLVPFHKLSQWLTYSLLEPLQDLEVEILNLDRLTGLAEYRNGGLFFDTGVIGLKDPSLLARAHAPGSPLVVAWRALTVSLLDRLAVPIRQKLGFTPETFPLVKLLQGGTWSAGRKLAASLRSQAHPPIQVESDGTVF